MRQDAAAIELLSFEIAGADNEEDDGGEKDKQVNEEDAEAGKEEAEEEEESGKEEVKQPGKVWREFGLVEHPKWYFTELATKKPVGILHQISPSSVKATCRSHPKCVCWLSRITDVLTTESDLVGWLHAGLSSSAAGHSALARNLKIQYGMRIR